MDDQHIFNETMPSVLEQYTRELVKKHALATKELDEQQLTEVIMQQIASGDIMKHVHYGWSNFGTGHKQEITYIPFRGIEQLKAENAELKRKLKLIEDALK